MMIKSFTKMMQSKRVACCIILLLGMALPTTAKDSAKIFSLDNAQGESLWDNWGEKSFWDKLCSGLWIFMTFAALVAAIVLPFFLINDDGGNSQFLIVMGIIGCGSFAIGSIAYYKLIGSNQKEITANEQYMVDHRQDNEWGVWGVVKHPKRWAKSKAFFISLWFLAMIIVSIHFLAQGNGPWSFMGGEQVMGAEVNTWLIVALSIGVCGLTISALIVPAIALRHRDEAEMEEKYGSGTKSMKLKFIGSPTNVTGGFNNVDKRENLTRQRVFNKTEAAENYKTCTQGHDDTERNQSSIAQPSTLRRLVECELRRSA